MKDKDIEELKKRLENVEFNNNDEDIEVVKEEKNDFFDEKKDKKKDRIILILGICVALLVIILIVFLLSGKGGNSDSPSDDKKNGSEQQETNSNNNNNNSENDNNVIESKIINENDYDYSLASVYFNKYIVVPSKDNKKTAITDFEGNILLQLSSNYKVYEKTDKNLYAIDIKDDTYVVKRIKDNIVHDVFNEKANGLLIDKENNNLMGLFRKDSKNDVYYILNNNGYDTVNLDSLGAYLNTNDSKDNKYIFNSKYAITYEADNEDFSNYGIFDISSKKQVVNGSYDKIDYLHDDIFAAVKDGKTGVINTSNNKLLDFKYDLVNYSNGLYFVGRNGKVEILDKDFRNLNKGFEVNNNPIDLIKYNDYVIVKVGYIKDFPSKYIAVDKLGNTTELGNGYIGFVNNYLVISNDSDNFINMYDNTLTIKHKIDVGQKLIKLDDIYIYLNNTLVINRAKLYDLTKDTTKGSTSWYRRISEEYEVRIDFKGEKGTVTISSNGQALKKLENVSVNEFLKANNNGITITKDYFIYNAGGVVVLKRENKTE